MAESLTAMTLKGVKWTSTSTLINAILQIVFFAITARLLDPAAFGLMAMSGVVLRFGSYFAQMGLGPALVQKDNIEKNEVAAAFTSSLFLGAGFFILTYSVAPLVEYIFRTSEIIPIVRVMSISFFLTGCSVTAVNLLKRNMQFSRLAIIDLISYFGYVVTGITLAYLKFGVWSLVASSIIQSFIVVILAYIMKPHSLKLSFKRADYQQLFSYGTKASAIGFFEFLGSNLDTLIIGHFLGKDALGLYNRVYLLVTLPIEYFVTSITKVLFPSYSKIQAQTARLKKAYLSSVLLVGAIILPICFGMIPASSQIITVVLGTKWLIATPVLQILAVATPFLNLTHISAIIFDAIGRLKIKLVFQLAYLIYQTILFFAFGSYGIFGIALALAVGLITQFIGFIMLTKELLRFTYREFFSVISIGAIMSFFVSLSIFINTYILIGFNLNQILLLFLQVLTGVVSLTMCIIIYPNQRFKDLIKSLLGHISIPLVRRWFKFG